MLKSKHQLEKYYCIICQKPVTKFLDNLFDSRYGAIGHYTIYKCKNCGFGQTYPRLKKEQIGDFYADHYPLSKINEDEVVKMGSDISKFKRRLFGNNIGYFCITPGAKVLDIGSGSGASLLEIQKLGGEAYGVEPDPNAQKIAKKLKLKVYKGFINDNPYPNLKFDFITANNVIEHDPDPKSFLKAINKKINDSGVVIISCPNINSFYRKIFGYLWIHWHVPYHMNFFSKESFFQLVNLTGFKILKIDTITPNLWTILQVATLFKKVKEGEKNRLWQPKKENKSVKVLNLRNKKTIFLETVVAFTMVILIFINRLIDLFGQGDSIIIWMVKRNTKENRNFPK